MLNIIKYFSQYWAILFSMCPIEVLASQRKKSLFNNATQKKNRINLGCWETAHLPLP